jgi:hypothetical protein
MVLRNDSLSIVSSKTEASSKPGIAGYFQQVFLTHFMICTRCQVIEKKKSLTSSGLEPATFQLTAQRLNLLRYRVPLTGSNRGQIYAKVCHLCHT